MKIARIANPLFSLLGYIKLPCENEPLAFPMLSFFLSRDDSEEFYRIFLCKIMGEIAKSYDMFVIGLAQNHFAVPTIDKLPSIHFKTKLYGITFPWSNQNYKEIDSRMIYPECALL